MKKIALVLSLLYSLTFQAQDQEIKKTVDDFFVAFHANDTIKIKSICSDKIILQSINENSKGGKLTDESVSDFYKAIGTIRPNVKFEEKILSYSIQVDGTMAHAWTPYEFYVNGKFSHKGVNAFTFFKENGIWKIIYLIDTRRK